MIKAIIIDDELHCIKSLKWDLHECAPQISIAGSAFSAAEGLNLIASENPELVFLDISMPGMNGFEMLEQLAEINFKIIFTTAFDQYAAKAFRKSAVDYLVKPIDKNDLIEALLKIPKDISNGMQEKTVINLLKNYREPEYNQRIAFPLRDGYEFVYPEQIMYLEAEGSYTNIFFREERKLLVSRSIGEISEMLPRELFIRIHHSNIVNLSSITHFLRSDGGYVQLKNGTRLMVSKARKPELMERLGLK